MTGSAPEALTVTALILPPPTAVTVMPSDGSASLLPEAGEIFRYLATVDAGLAATAVGLSWLATGALAWQAVRAARRQR